MAIETLPRIPTKEQEVDFLKSLVTSLPRCSYLRPVLEPFVVDFEREIYSDLIPTVRDSWEARKAAWDEVQKARDELAAVRKEIGKAKIELADQLRRVDSVVDSLLSVSKSVGTSLKVANDAASRIHSKVRTGASS